VDPTGAVFRLYDAEAGATYLVRPDGHVVGRWRSPRAATITQAVRRILHPSH
jgi:3-(3-hydroxy-phenyl)propionate hydroxylase